MFQMILFNISISIIIRKFIWYSCLGHYIWFDVLLRVYTDHHWVLQV